MFLSHSSSLHHTLFRAINVIVTNPGVQRLDDVIDSLNNLSHVTTLGTSLLWVGFPSTSMLSFFLFRMGVTLFATVDFTTLSMSSQRFAITSSRRPCPSQNQYLQKLIPFSNAYREGVYRLTINLFASPKYASQLATNRKSNFTHFSNSTAQSSYSHV